MFAKGEIESGRRPEVDPAALAEEDLVPLTQKAKELGCDLAALHRAAMTGTLSRPGPNGERRRVYLGVVKILGRHYTSKQAWARYLRASNGVPETTGENTGSLPSIPTRRTPAQRKAAVDRANREAAALGC